MIRNDVLIAGAGPTGLVLALWLTRQGVNVRIIDKAAEAGTTSRAVAVAAHTLELYRQLDLADAVRDQGYKVPAANLWVKGERAAHIPLEAVGKDLSPYGFLQTFPQDAHERLLIARLEELGVTVERQTELVGYTDQGDTVSATLRGPRGEETVQAMFLAGCDGAHSTVRKDSGNEFEGGTYRQLFYVADIEASGEPVNGELHIDLDQADFLAIFPLDAKGHARLIGAVRDERAEHADDLTFEDISTRPIENLKIRIDKVNWFSTYHVHHRVTDHFRKGRVFLLGDAAHVHSPVGGQGMNTGIGDAINLAWKLKAVLAGQAPDNLLDTYQTERIAFARRLVATTDRVFTFVSSDGRLADLVRTRIAPFAVPKILGVERVREFIFRTVSQIALNYRDSALSAGSAGEVHGGERLPWAPVEGTDNFASLKDIAWQVHVYGTANDDLVAWCKQHALALHVFAWRPAYEEAGLVRNALYLLRPDTYVGLVEAQGSVAALERYFRERGLRLHGVEGCG
jgi:2-polyprenyl-6-methoxyphenol hydroxylase-like FAD-dependent oxidoreductase